MTVKSRDLSQTKMKITVRKAEQILKNDNYFTQNENFCPFWVKNDCHYVNFVSFTTSPFFSARDKSRDPTVNSQLLEQMQTNLGSYSLALVHSIPSLCSGACCSSKIDQKPVSTSVEKQTIGAKSAFYWNKFIMGHQTELT